MLSPAVLELPIPDSRRFIMGPREQKSRSAKFGSVGQSGFILGIIVFGIRATLSHELIVILASLLLSVPMSCYNKNVGLQKHNKPFLSTKHRRWMRHAHLKWLNMFCLSCLMSKSKQPSLALGLDTPSRHVTSKHHETQ
jgi:hypothetical protein